MRFKLELEQKLGQAVVAELTHLVVTGAIGRSQVKEMSYEHHMNVNMVYNDSRDKEENPDLTMKRMLDRWCEISVCFLSASDAQRKLLEILRESNCSPLTVHKISQLCGGEEASGENRGSFTGSNIEQ